MKRQQLLAAALAVAARRRCRRRRPRRRSSSFPPTSTGSARMRPAAPASPAACIDYFAAAQRARRRHQRRQAHLGEVRDRVQQRPRRRVLRALEEEGPDRRDGGPPAVHRHHLFADRQGAPPTRSRSSRSATAAPTPSDGRVFPYIFPLITNYWSQNTAKIKFIGQKEGGMDKLKGKKIVNLYHDSAYGKETIPVLDVQAKKYGFEVTHIAGAAPGQRAAVAVAADPPDQARLGDPARLGRDEPDRAQGRGARSATRATRSSACGGRARRRT